MTDTTATDQTGATPLIEARGLSKYFGSVIALQDVSMYVNAGEVLCLLGDNGAGKSTLIKTLSGVHLPDAGQMFVDGTEVHFGSPRDALQAGIATVYQDLAMIPLMSISRNFFLGSEPTTGLGPVRMYDGGTADRVTREALKGMGIDLRHVAAGRHPLRWRAAVSRHRARHPLRGKGRHPRRADLGARREGGWRRAPLHRPGPRVGHRRHPHHP